MISWVVFSTIHHKERTILLGWKPARGWGVGPVSAGVLCVAVTTKDCFLNTSETLVKIAVSINTSLNSRNASQLEADFVFYWFLITSRHIQALKRSLGSLRDL